MRRPTTGRRRPRGPRCRRIPRARWTAAPWPVILLLLSLLVPYEASQFVGPLRISAYRMVLLLLVPWCLVRILEGRVRRWLAADWLVLAYAVWTFAVIALHHGSERALESGGVYALEGLGAYLVARCFLRDRAAFIGTVAVLTAIVLALMTVTVPEMLTGRHLVHDAARTVFGGERVLDKPTRLGLCRAYGPFPHPILSGTFCASCLGLAWYALAAGFGHRLRWSALIVVSAMTSLSSGPVFALAAQVAVIAWDALTRRVAGRWLIFALVLALGWITLDVLSNRSPVEVLLTRLAFNPDTGYGRLIIWQHGLRQIADHPWLGIGLRDWSNVYWMGRSIDSFWIFTGVKFGLPAVGLVIGAVASMATALGRRRVSDTSGRRIRLAWMTSIAGLCVAGLGVHFWDELYVLFMFLLGSAAWLAEGCPRRATRGSRLKRPNRVIPATEPAEG